MPSIITAGELRDVLGVSSSLYSDAYLDQIIESAEGVILPLLTQYQNAIATTRIEDGVLYCVTLRPSYFAEGQTVIIAGTGVDTNGTYVITLDTTKPLEFFSRNQSCRSCCLCDYPIGNRNTRRLQFSRTLR
jgi:hypothetical protein